MFLSPSEVVDKPCRELLSHPLQCFQELFLATPAVVGSFFLGVGGFTVAVIIWGALFALTLFTILYLLKQLVRGTKYFFQQTKIGQKLLAIIPFKSYIQRFFTKAQEVQPKRLINAQAIGDLGANLVSKVHVDTKWFKNATKHLTFSSSKANESNGNSSARSPAKTPQRSTSRLSNLTPKILSPKLHKQ